MTSNSREDMAILAGKSSVTTYVSHGSLCPASRVEHADAEASSLLSSADDLWFDRRC